MNNSSTKNTRSQDFRRVFANTFSVAFSATEAQIIYGIQSNPGTDDVTMEEQVGVIFTHTAAKLMGQMLTLLVSDFEEASGTEIALDPAKLAGLQTLIDQAKAARAKQGANPT